MDRHDYIGIIGGFCHKDSLGVDKTRLRISLVIKGNDYGHLSETFNRALPKQSPVAMAICNSPYKFRQDNPLWDVKAH